MDTGLFKRVFENTAIQKLGLNGNETDFECNFEAQDAIVKLERRLREFLAEKALVRPGVKMSDSTQSMLSRDIMQAAAGCWRAKVQFRLKPGELNEHVPNALKSQEATLEALNAAFNETVEASIPTKFKSAKNQDKLSPVAASR